MMIRSRYAAVTEIRYMDPTRNGRSINIIRTSDAVIRTFVVFWMPECTGVLTEWKEDNIWFAISESRTAVYSGSWSCEINLYTLNSSFFFSPSLNTHAIGSLEYLNYVRSCSPRAIPSGLLEVVSHDLTTYPTICWVWCSPVMLRKWTWKMSTTGSGSVEEPVNPYSTCYTLSSSSSTLVQPILTKV